MGIWKSDKVKVCLCAVLVTAALIEAQLFILGW